MAPHSSTLAWRIPGTGDPGGLPSMGLHRVRHNWSDLAAAAAGVPDSFVWLIYNFYIFKHIVWASWFLQWSCMDVRVGLWRKLSAQELMLLNCGVGEDSWELLELQGDPSSPFWRRSALGFLWKEWCSGWNSSTLATSCEELTSWKRLWCWEGLGARGEGDGRGWDGWMASLTQWTWVWVNSGSWWWTGRPGVLWFMGLQRVGHGWVTELNWTKLMGFIYTLDLEPWMWVDRSIKCFSECSQDFIPIHWDVW